MFTDPLEEQEWRRSALARRHPEAYNALAEQEQKHRQKVAESPDALDRLIDKIKRFFCRRRR